jgi:hypothetical protein
MRIFDQAIEAALARLSQGKAPPVLRTLARHAAQILSMRADGTADLATDDEAVAGPGGLGGRPVLTGLPGVRLNLFGGDRARVVFAAGSPSGAEVSGFEQDRSADRPVARKGDRVDLGTLIASAAPSPIIGIPTALLLTITPTPSPFSVEVPTPFALLLPGAALIGIELGEPYAIEGWVSSGSPEISLRRLTTETIP